MARTRSIKPSFFDNDVLGDLPPLTRLLFIGLWCHADREGRLEDRPRKIKKAVLGYDDVDANGVSDMLQALHDTGFITRYEAQGERYIQVVNFVKHQNPHMKEKASEIPPPSGPAPYTYSGSLDDEEEKPGASTGQEPGQHQEEAEPQITPRGPDGEEQDGEEEPPEGAPPEKKLSPIERRFELFWGAYPKKRAKEAARKAFKKVKPDEKLFNHIMEAIGRARTSKEWLREGGQFIPNPATWLNGGCWDDEIEEVTDHGHHSSHYGQHGAGQPAQPSAGAGKPGALTGFKSAADEYGTDDQ